MNHAISIYRAQTAPLIEFLALVEPTPDGYTVQLSPSEIRRYEDLSLLAVTENSPENASNAGRRIDTRSPEFEQQVRHATQAITESAPAMHQLQRLLDLKPVGQAFFRSNWSCFSDSDVVILARDALRPCLRVLEQIGVPAITFTSVESEAHAGKLQNAGQRELRFRDGGQEYLAMSPRRWQEISAAAATTLFEHLALITKIAGLLLSMDRPAHQLIRLVGLHQNAAALMQAFNSLGSAMRQSNQASYWARLRDFNEAIRRIRVSSALASASCDRYFTDSRRLGKTILPPVLQTPELPNATPMMVCDRGSWAEAKEDEEMPLLDHESLDLISGDWPGLWMGSVPAAMDTHEPRIGGLAGEHSIDETAQRHKHGSLSSVTRMAGSCYGNQELITEQVEEHEWEASTGVAAFPGGPPLSEAISAVADRGPKISIPAPLDMTGTAGAQTAPNFQDVSGPYATLLPLFQQTAAFPFQALAAILNLAQQRQLQATHYRNVAFGKSVCLFGTPVIGSGTSIGDNAVIHERVCLPRCTIVKAGTVLSHCRFNDAQLKIPAMLVLSGDPSGDLDKLQFLPGKASCRIELGTVHFILSGTTVVPGGIQFLSGATVKHFDVGQTEMNSCRVQGSLHLVNPSLGANVRFGPDVVVERNVKIGNDVTFEGSNLVKAGSEIGEGAVIQKGVNVSGTVAPFATVTAATATMLAELLPGAAVAALEIVMARPVGLTPARRESKVTGMSGVEKPQQPKPVKVIDLTDDEVTAESTLSASAPRAAWQQAPLPGQPCPAASPLSFLPLPGMGNNNCLTPAPSLTSPGLQSSPPGWQLLPPLPPPVSLISPMLVPLPVPVLPPEPRVQGTVLPRLQNDLIANASAHGLVLAPPPPVPLMPRAQQGPGYRQVPTAQAPAVHGNVPGINAETYPPISHPQSFPPFVLRKPGL